VFWQLHEPGGTLVKEIPNEFSLTSTFEFVSSNVFNIHITLLIGLRKCPVENITPVSVHHFLDAINVPIGTVRGKICLGARVLPDGHRHVVNPLLLEPETDCGTNVAV